uniref:RWD domain-containing protein 3 n=1 Tax=Takifugu rubripes TaxID=31033 RepID=A0A674N2C4_TAKRU
MSEAALEEVSVLSSIYCGEEETLSVIPLRLFGSGQDGLVVHIKQTVGGEGGPDISLSFHLPPAYPSCPPSRCYNRLVEGVQVRVLLRSHTHTTPHTHSSTCLPVFPQEHVQRMDTCAGRDEEAAPDPDRTVVLLLDHIRDRRRYIKLLERWTHQLQLSGMLFLGRSILLILQGDRLQVKVTVILSPLKTVKIDVDSSGKKCKDKMMKVLIEASRPSTERLQNGLQIQEDVQEHGKTHVEGLSNAQSELWVLGHHRGCPRRTEPLEDPCERRSPQW